MPVLIAGGVVFSGQQPCDAFPAKGQEIHPIDDLSDGQIGQLAECL